MQLFRTPPTPEQLHDSLVPGILTQAIILIIVPTIAVILRFWARLVRKELKLCTLWFEFYISDKQMANGFVYRVGRLSYCIYLGILGPTTILQWPRNIDNDPLDMLQCAPRWLHG